MIHGAMRGELQIIWDGQGPGLSEHRLSVAALGPPLTLLLTAIRRIATNLLSDATDSERGSRGGRFSRFAEGIDLRLSVVEQGCLHLCADVVFPDPDESGLDLFASVDDLAGRTLESLLEAIEGESQGHPRSAVVRKFLKSLEGIVSSQSYRASVNGRLLAETSVGEPTLLTEPTLASYMVKYRGHITGLIFEPKPEVRLRTEGQIHRLQASQELVNQALALHGDEVTTYAMRSSSGVACLIHIEPSSGHAAELGTSTSQRSLIERWGVVLERLGKMTT
jgi:hypothetical protein